MRFAVRARDGRLLWLEVERQRAADQREVAVAAVSDVVLHERRVMAEEPVGRIERMELFNVAREDGRALVVARGREPFGIDVACQRLGVLVMDGLHDFFHGVLRRALGALCIGVSAHGDEQQGKKDGKELLGLHLVLPLYKLLSYAI